MKTVLVLGATGLMGKLVCDLACRLLPDASVISGSRRMVSDEEHRQVDIHNPRSLKEALAGVNVVINVVGPYTYDPTPLVNACFENGCHYVDIAEVPAFITQVYQAATQCRERTGGSIAVIPGCSTVPAMIEVIAAGWEDDPALAKVRAYLSMGSKNPVSPALVYSLLLPLSQRHPRAFTRLEHKRFDAETSRVFGAYPSPFDESGIRLKDKCLPAEFAICFDRAFYSLALWSMARILPFMPDGLIRAVSRLSQPVMPLVNLLGTYRGILVVEGCDANGKVLHAARIQAERNGLSIPALPSVWSARKLLNLSQSDARRLDDLMDAGEMATALRKEGYRAEGDLSANPPIASLTT